MQFQQKAVAAHTANLLRHFKLRVRQKIEGLFVRGVVDGYLRLGGHVHALRFDEPLKRITELIYERLIGRFRDEAAAAATVRQHDGQARLFLGSPFERVRLEDLR